jgi:hypothetical protein
LNSRAPACLVTLLSFIVSVKKKPAACEVQGDSLNTFIGWLLTWRIAWYKLTATHRCVKAPVLIAIKRCAATTRRGTMRKRILFWAALFLIVAGVADNLYAYTYAFHNRTGHLIKVIVEVYDGEDRVSEVEAYGSYSFSTGLLLKSWKVEAFLENRWEQVMHNTCDLLPGNHTFSVHADETREPGGRVERNWYSTYQ